MIIHNIYKLTFYILLKRKPNRIMKLSSKLSAQLPFHHGYIYNLNMSPVYTRDNCSQFEERENMISIFYFQYQYAANVFCTIV